MAVNQIVVKVGATVGDLVINLGRGGDAVDNFGNRVRRGGNNAAAGFDGMTGALRRFALEQGQQGRVMNRITAEITALIPMSREASSVLSAFGGVAWESAQGIMTVGGALAVAGLAVSAYNALTKDATEQIKRLDAELEAGLKRLEQAGEKARAQLILMNQTAFNDPKVAARAADQMKTFGDARETVGTLTAQLEEAQKRLADFNERARFDPAMRIAGAVSNVRGEVDGLARKLAEAKANLDALNRTQLTPETMAMLAGFRGMGQGATAGLTSDEVSAGDAATKAASEAAKAWQEKVDRAPADDAARRAYNLRQYGGYGTDPYVNDAARDRAMDNFRSPGSSFDMAGASAFLTAGASQAQAAKAEKDREKALQNHKRQVEELRASYRQFGDTAAAGLGGVIAGHRKMGDVMRELGAQAVQIAAKWAITQITNTSLVAGAKGAASSAEAGPPGVIAAPAVMAAMISMVAALLGGVISSAEGGWRLPDSGGPFPMVGHKGERMLNARQNKDYEDTQALLRSGRAGGGTVYDLRGARLYGRGAYEELVRESGRGAARAHRRSARRGAN